VDYYVGGDDYVSGSYSLTLTSSSFSVIGQVRIIDDDLCDAPEQFTLTIDSASLPSEVAVENGCQQVVMIVDNGTLIVIDEYYYRLYLFFVAPSVSFDAAMYTASEVDSYSEIIAITMTEPCLSPFYEVVINSADVSAEGDY